MRAITAKSRYLTSGMKKSTIFIGNLDFKDMIGNPSHRLSQTSASVAHFDLALTHHEWQQR